MRKIKQYEFSIEIDEYIFNRFVKNKVRKPYNNFNTSIENIINYIKENPGWRISLQTHKWMKIP